MAKQKVKAKKAKKESKKLLTKKPVTKKETAKKKETKAVTKKSETKKKELKKTESKAVKTNEKATKEDPVTVSASPKPVASNPDSKKRLLISYEKLPPEVIEVIRTKYPYGYSHDLKEVKGIDNKKLHVLPIELPEAVYLVKVDLKKPIKIAEEVEDEDDGYTSEEGFAGEDEGFPDEEIEQMDGEEEEEPKSKKKSKKDDYDDDDD